MPEPLPDLLPGENHEEWYRAWRAKLDKQVEEREREDAAERERRRIAGTKYLIDQLLIWGILGVMAYFAVQM